MKKTNGLFGGLFGWFKSQAKCLNYKRIIKKQEEEIRELNKIIEELTSLNDALQLQLDKDNKIRQIKYLEKRVEEMYLIKNDLIKDKKVLEQANIKLNKRLKGK